MHRLLYISTARVMLNREQLNDVLRVSRRNNAAADVTGLLVVGGRRFLQVLEGPTAAVHTTFDRIRADPRHFAAVVLADQSITERSFDGWAMGYKPGAEVTGKQDIAKDIEALLAPIADPALHGYFHGFAQTHAHG
ncbi:MAG TPA: BLUF domain-containing protein [Sphingomonas sp.]|jgi:hypothetical protein|nr:BLUF domain-containing protein [Sphingomonas sp.]